MPSARVTCSPRSSTAYAVASAWLPWCSGKCVVEEGPPAGDHLGAARRVVRRPALAPVVLGDRVGAVERVVERAPPRVGRVRGEPGVQRRHHQLRAGLHGDLVVDPVGLDRRRRPARRRGSRSRGGTTRTPPGRPVRARRRGSRRGAAGSRRGVASSDRLRGAKSSRIASTPAQNAGLVDARAGQRLVPRRSRAAPSPPGAVPRSPDQQSCAQFYLAHMVDLAPLVSDAGRRRGAGRPGPDGRLPLGPGQRPGRRGAAGGGAGGLDRGRPGGGAVRGRARPGGGPARRRERARPAARRRSTAAWWCRPSG